MNRLGRLARSDLVVVAIAVALLSLFALWRMGHLAPSTADRARLTDNTRSAYVAKNLVEGRGYTTNDLPAALLDTYQQTEHLDDARWANADRFPFTVYGIAALYMVTGSTSSWVGIVVYNYLTFGGFALCLFAFARTVWRDRTAGLLALVLALMHPYTYVLLYLKDADTALLATGFFFALFRWRLAPAHTASLGLRVTVGTLLGWSFLARPNVGAAFVIALAWIGLRDAWRTRTTDGWGPSARRLVATYAVPAIVMIAWCLPFAITTMDEWGSPFWSANSTYQLPLGTRFGMGTDTWWKYIEPGQTLSLGEMWRADPGAMRTKLTSSWLATYTTTLRMYGVELLATVALAGWMRRRNLKASAEAAAEDDAQVRARAFLTVLGVAGFATMFNLAVLPMYAYQRYAFVHYLGFALPVVWVGAGAVAVRAIRAIVGAWPRITEWVASHQGATVVAVVLATLLWGLGATNVITNPWLIRPARLMARHWLLAGAILGALLMRPRRWSFPWAVALSFGVILARYRTDTSIRRTQAVFFPLTDHPAEVLRQRDGLVSSLALQSEVAWMSGRKNVPVPEYALHLYSYELDYGLHVEDIYLESAEAMITPGVGAFAHAAPGFETYARIQQHGGTLPGFERVLHETGTRAYTRSVSIAKASTILRRSGDAATTAMFSSPQVLHLGSVDAIVHTAYGFEDYHVVNGRPAVLTSDRVRRRYEKALEAPYADLGVTFFLDERVPRELDLEVFSTGPMNVEVYLNVDRDAWTPMNERGQHRATTVSLAGGRWERVHVMVPPALVRRGLNTLALTPSAYYPTILCPQDQSELSCLATPAVDLPTGDPDTGSPRLIRVANGPARAVRSAGFLGDLTFSYSP